MYSRCGSFVVAVSLTALFASLLPLGASRVSAASLFEIARDGVVEPEAAGVTSGSAVDRESSAARLRIVDNGLAADTLVEPAQSGGSVEQLLAGLGFSLAPEDIVYPSRAEPAPRFGAVYILRAPAVTLVHDGEQTQVKTRATTVGQLLSERGVTLDSDDRVEPNLQSAVVPNQSVRVVRVNTKEIKEKESIAFETSTKDDATIYEGETTVSTAGKTGEREFTYKLTLEDGRQVKKEKVAERVLLEPVKEVIARGTKVRPKTASQGPYKDLINAAALQYGVDGTELMSVMLCESGGNPNSTSAGGKYIGLFQYTQDFWDGGWNSYRAGGIRDPHSQIYATALAWSLGWRGRWGC